MSALFSTPRHTTVLQHTRGKTTQTPVSSTHGHRSKAVACIPVDGWTVAFKATKKNTHTMFAVRNTTPQQLRNDLAENVRHYRALKYLPPEKPLSQERCAWAAGIDRTMMSKIERAKTNPSLDTLLKLANYLDVSVADLLATPNHAPAGRKK